MSINDTLAPTTEMSTGNSISAFVIQIVLISIIFYVLLIRPQQKKMKEHLAMIKSLKVGDRVLTNSGIYGLVHKIKEKELDIEISHNVIITIDIMSVSSIVISETEAKLQKK